MFSQVRQVDGFTGGAQTWCTTIWQPPRGRGPTPALPTDCQLSSSRSNAHRSLKYLWLIYGSVTGLGYKAQGQGFDAFQTTDCQLSSCRFRRQTAVVILKYMASSRRMQIFVPTELNPQAVSRCPAADDTFMLQGQCFSTTEFFFVVLTNASHRLPSVAVS